MNIYLSLILFLPLIGAALTFFIKPREIARVVALVFSVIPLFITALLLTTFESGSGFQFPENYTWISSLGINYTLGVDGISMPLILLNAILCPLTIIYSWGCLLYTSPSPRDVEESRMPSSA